MRRVASAALFVGSLAALAVVVSCASPEQTSEMVVDEAQVTDQEVATLIQGHVDFAKPLTLELMTGVTSPTSQALSAEGYLETLQTGRARFALTPKGRDHGVIEWEAERDRPFLIVPVAHLELVEITANEKWDRVAPARQVEFLYRRTPSQLGQTLLDAGSKVGALSELSERRGAATLVKYDDGWRVQTLAL